MTKLIKIILAALAVAILAGLLANLPANAAGKPKPEPPASGYTLGYELVQEEWTHTNFEQHQSGSGDEIEYWATWDYPAMVITCPEGKVAINGDADYGVDGGDRPDFDDPAKWIIAPEPTEGGGDVGGQPVTEPEPIKGWAICVNTGTV